MSELVRLAKEALRQQRSIDLVWQQPGDRITWGHPAAVRHGTVDYLHTDADGTRWAFVTIGETWAVVNMKFVTRSGDSWLAAVHLP